MTTSRPRSLRQKVDVYNTAVLESEVDTCLRHILTVKVICDPAQHTLDVQSIYFFSFIFCLDSVTAIRKGKLATVSS